MNRAVISERVWVLVSMTSSTVYGTMQHRLSDTVAGHGWHRGENKQTHLWPLVVQNKPTSHIRRGNPTTIDSIQVGGLVPQTSLQRKNGGRQKQLAYIRVHLIPDVQNSPTPVSGKQYTATATPGTPLQALRNHSIRQADIYHSGHYEAYKTYKNPAFPSSLQSSYSSESFPFPPPYRPYLPHIPCAGSHRQYSSSPFYSTSTSLDKTNMLFSQVAFSVSVTLVAAVSASPLAMDYNGQLQRRGGSAAPFTLQNGQEAQALNRKFQSLTASSSCSSGEQACVQGQLAQCVSGKFVLAPCASTLQCVALPLVNKPGTRYAQKLVLFPSLLEGFYRLWLTYLKWRHSITCDTQQDAEARIANTGATGGLVGKREIEARYVVSGFSFLGPHTETELTLGSAH